MGHFVAVDLPSVLGSWYCWAIKRTLSKVIGKVGMCGRSWCEGVAGETPPCWVWLQIEAVAQVQSRVHPFPVYRRSHWTPSSIPGILACLSIEGAERRVLPTWGWPHCKFRCSVWMGVEIYCLPRGVPPDYCTSRAALGICSEECGKCEEKKSSVKQQK